MPDTRHLPDAQYLKGRILVTGAGGFVGRHLVRALGKVCDRNTDHIALVHNAPAVSGSDPMLWKGLSCDLTDADAIDSVIETHSPDFIIHLAAQSSVGKSLGGQRAATWTTNLLSTLNLARAVGRHAPEATLLFASTCEVYGAAFLNGLVSEETTPLPKNPYSRSKLCCEQLLEDVLPETVRLVVCRPTNHSGPGQSPTFVIPDFASQVAKIELGLSSPVMSVGNLEAKRDFVHVDDVVRAMTDLLLKADSLPERTVFNICSGVTVRMREVLDGLLDLAHCPIEVTQDPNRLRPGEIAETRLSAERLEGVIGWKPLPRLADILNDVLSDQRRIQERQEVDSGA